MNTITCLCLLLAIGSLNASPFGFPKFGNPEAVLDAGAQVGDIANGKAHFVGQFHDGVASLGGNFGAQVGNIVDGNANLAGQVQDGLGSLGASVNLGVADILKAQVNARANLKIDCNDCQQLELVLTACGDLLDKEYLLNFYASVLATVKNAGKDCSLVNIRANGKVVGAVSADAELSTLVKAVADLTVDLQKVDLSDTVANLQADVNVGALFGKTTLIVVHINELLNPKSLLLVAALVKVLGLNLRIFVVGPLPIQLSVLASILDGVVFVETYADLEKIDVSLALGLCQRSECDSCSDVVVMPALGLHAHADVKTKLIDICAAIFATVDLTGKACNRHFLSINGKVSLDINVQEAINDLVSGDSNHLLNSILKVDVEAELNLNAIFKKRTYLIVLANVDLLSPQLLSGMIKLGLTGRVVVAGFGLSVEIQNLLKGQVDHLLVFSSISAAINFDWNRALKLCTKNPPPQKPPAQNPPAQDPPAQNPPAKKCSDLNICTVIIIDASASTRVEAFNNYVRPFAKNLVRAISARSGVATFVLESFATHAEMAYAKLITDDAEACEEIDQVKGGRGTTHCELALRLLYETAIQLCPKGSYVHAVSISDGNCTLIPESIQAAKEVYEHGCDLSWIYGPQITKLNLQLNKEMVPNDKNRHYFNGFPHMIEDKSADRVADIICEDGVAKANKPQPS